jgi:hypothetical protein
VTILAAPLILAAHAATLPTLPGWDGVRVYEGAVMRRDDLQEWVSVGFVADQDSPTISLEPVPNAQGENREAGEVVCQLLTARRDVPTARARVFELLAPWAAWLVADRTLGGVLLAGSELHLRASVALATTRNGATGDALVTITYSATTYG